MQFNAWIKTLQSPQLFQTSLLIFALIFCLFVVLWIVFHVQKKRLSEHYQQLKQQYQYLSLQKQNQEENLISLKTEEQQLESRLDQSRQNILELSEENARYMEQLRLLKEHNLEFQAQQKSQQHEQHKQLENQFSVLAQKIFDEKLQQTEKHQKESLENSLKPFKDQLGSFQKKVEEIYDKDLRDRVSLTHEIGHLKKLNMQISDDAVRLTQALRGQNKIQGNWGEMILEQVLEDSGLRKGHEYETQTSHKSESGKRLIPDVVVHLPNDKDIVIDSKVSLISYERYISAQDDEARALALKDFLQSLRKHLNDLNSKAYEKLENIRTLDFVFLFIPIEAAFLLALEHDTELFRTAFNKQVVLVSPTTLFACLRTVEHLWRYERQNKHAEEIARQAAGLHDKLVNFSDSLIKIGDALGRAADSHSTALKQFSSGQGNVLGRVRKLQKMGVPTKKRFDKSLINSDDIEASSRLASNPNENKSLKDKEGLDKKNEEEQEEE